MVDKATVLQIFGCLMKHPQYLSESDKYNLTPDDFFYRFDKFIFTAIDSLYRNGATSIQPIDVENYLSTNESAKLIFKQQNGIEYLQDADYLAAAENFSYYYKKLKKFNLLENLSSQGFDTSIFYVENPLKPADFEINAKFENLEVQDIVAGLKKKLLGVERKYIQNDTSETIDVFEGIEDIIAEAGGNEFIGVPLQGEIFNEVCAGARKGTFVIRSAASGVGKSRSAVGDACYLAFPFRYNIDTQEWEQNGNCEKTMIITTEQTASEVQKMVLAYLTGFNETKFRYGNFTDEEMHIIKQALWVLETYRDNLYIVKMPNPSIELVKTIVRENVLTHNIEYVFYDYIHICPSLLAEFKGYNLRNDEVLLMFSTALKDLAVELNIFVMSSTQLNANGDSSTNIRNEAAIAGSRAIVNKADIGCILARPTKEELDFLTNENDISFYPTIVCDIYKVRAGQYNQIRIWSDYDAGNLRKKDLFATDARMNVIPIGSNINYQISFEDDKIKEYSEFLKQLKTI